MKRHGVLAVGSVALLGACSIFTDLSGYSLPEDPAMAGSPTEPGRGDAAGGVEGSSGETGVAPNGDAGTGGPSPEGGSPPRFCAVAAADFCEDFDGANFGLPFSWTLTGAMNATHGVDDMLSRSPSGSLWAQTSLLGAGDTAFSYRYVRLGTAAHVLDYAFQIYVEKEGSPGLVVAGVGLEDPAHTGLLAELVLGGSVDSIRETRTTNTGTQTLNHALLAGVPLATWTPVKLHLVDLGGPGWGITVTMGTATVLSGTTLGLWTPQAGAAATVSVGVVGMRGASSPWRVRIDDLTLNGAK